MAGEIEDAIERADRESFTKEPPKTFEGQIGFLIKQFGSAKAVAAELGVTADSVNRYRRGARKHARADVAAKIDDAVRHRDAGASDQQMRGIIAEGFKEVHFQDGGGRAMGLSDVVINDIDYLDLAY
ncbi:hypothetical protein ABZ499_30215 [Streptomyces sp. NPDC019990]|uniref:hypothetical protein n=1 Tax=Streptomyces sp. NPDC019990 TaxID=3154693 RepID=UPI0033E2FD6D